MCEPGLREALAEYINNGHENEKQLSQLVLDLLDLCGDQPVVVQYINIKAAEAMEETSPWG